MTKKKALSPELKAECAALEAIFLAKKNELKLSLKKIADLAGKSPPAIKYYLDGTNPLNASIAVIFAKVLEVEVGDFSPRLAEEIASLYQASPRHYYQDDLYQNATPAHRQVVDEIASHMLELSPEQALKLKQAMELLMPTNDSRKD